MPVSSTLTIYLRPASICVEVFLRVEYFSKMIVGIPLMRGLRACGKQRGGNPRAAAAARNLLSAEVHADSIMSCFIFWSSASSVLARLDVRANFAFWRCLGSAKAATLAVSRNRVEPAELDFSNQKKIKLRRLNSIVKSIST